MASTERPSRCYCLAALLLWPVAALADVPEPDDYWTGPINSDVPATIAGGTVIHAQELARLLRTEKAVIVDVSNAPVRPATMAPGAAWMPLPHDTIPRSSWLAGVGQGRITSELELSFASRLAQLTGGDLDRRIVVYCHERCWLSWNAARRAIRLGYRRVSWFPEGIEGWRAAGFKTTAVNSPDETSSPPSTR
jgi:PQQ-dependent catabolism-associated CXXCW motif protein